MTSLPLTHIRRRNKKKSIMRDSFIHGMRLALAALWAVFLLSSCIDEDLSDCGKDYRIDYTVHLRTSITTEMSAHLATPAEQAIGSQVLAGLRDVFTDHARDIDLAFYTADHMLAQHEQHQMDASQASYTIYLPVKDYSHVALADAAAEPLVSAEGSAQLGTFAVRQTPADTIDSHSVGLFSARLPMHVEDRDQEFHVNLYMLNAASCLLLSAGDVRPDRVWGYADGLADAFSLSDSLYTASRNTVVRERMLHEPQGNTYALYAATMPSAGTAPWHIYIYVAIGGKTTLTTLTVDDPLRAGTLRVLKGAIRADGSVATDTKGVGVSVKLDWKPGGSHDIEI